MANCRWLCLLWLAVSQPILADDKQPQIDSAMQAGRYVEAETLLRQQIDVNPANWDAHFRLAKVLSWQKKFAQAQLEYQALLAREADNADYLLGLAQVGVWRGDAHAALPLIETAKSLAPGDPDIWRLHIQALAAVNDPHRSDKLSTSSSRLHAVFLNWTGISPETLIKLLPHARPASALFILTRSSWAGHTSILIKIRAFGVPNI